MNPSRAITQGILMLCALILGFGLWAGLSRIEGAVVLGARIEPKGGRHLLQHPHGGRLITIAVNEGQEVKAGAILAEIDSTSIGIERDALAADMTELLARKSRLEAEMQGLNPAQENRLQEGLWAAHLGITEQEAALFDRQTAQIAETLRGIKAQSDAITRQSSLIAQERQTNEGLYARGLSQIGPLLALQREEARLMGQAGDLSAAQSAAKERLLEITHHRERAQLQRRVDLLTELQELNPRLTALQARQRILEETYAARYLRAPFDGFIHGLRLRSYLGAGEVFAELLPKVTELVAIVEVPPHLIGQITLGQRVKLVSASMGGQDQPPLYGHLRALSPDLYHPSQGAPYFLVEIALPDPPPIPLRSGMGFEAYILSPARSPLKWLLQPLSAYFRPALREN